MQQEKLRAFSALSFFQCSANGCGAIRRPEKNAPSFFLYSEPPSSRTFSSPLRSSASSRKRHPCRLRIIGRRGILNRHVHLQEQHLSRAERLFRSFAVFIENFRFRIDSKAAQVRTMRIRLRDITENGFFVDSDNTRFVGSRFPFRLFLRKAYQKEECRKSSDQQNEDRNFLFHPKPSLFLQSS